MTQNSKWEKLITDYFTKETNYAILISGVWGIGKTYFLKKQVIPKIEELKDQCYRSIYISLSGLRNIDDLKELMFSRVNVSYQVTKTQMDIECDVLRSVIGENDLLPLISIPKNIVFCFDDLERINPTLFEEALGFINQYIEQKGVKVIFLCDENRLKDEIHKRYNIIKEKYIRYTIGLNPCFFDILNSQPNKLSDDEKFLLIRRFEQGECGNLRTLIYSIDLINSLNEEIESLLKTDNCEYKLLIRKLIINYTSLFSIEKKKGVAYNTLLKINFPKRILSPRELGLNVVLSDNGESEQEITKNGDQEEEKKILKDIHNKYFDDKTDLFEPFTSIAEYIEFGYFNNNMLVEEVKNIIQSLKKKKGTHEEHFFKKINDIFNFTEKGYLKEIETILEEVDRGDFSLDTYLQAFSQLLVLESYEIDGVNIDDKIIKRFVEGMNKSSNDKKILYDSNLNLKYGHLWYSDEDSPQREKYKELFSFAQKLNNNSPKSKESTIEPLLELINKENEDELNKFLVERKWDFLLREEDARPIFDIILEKEAKIIIIFLSALKDRYILKDTQTRASDEYPFMKKLSLLIDEFVKQKCVRTIRFIALLQLKYYLNDRIMYFKLDKSNYEIQK